MLIFVILSITDAYHSKLSQSQSLRLSSHLCYHYHSRAAIFCRPSPSIIVFCSPILRPYPPPYHPPSPLPSPICPLRSRPFLSRLCRPCPIIFPASPPCPPPIFCPILCPLHPLPSSGPPSALPPQYYDNTRLISSTFPMPPTYLNGIPGNNYRSQLPDNAYLTDNIEVAEKSTTSTTYHTYPRVILSRKNSKSAESIRSSSQQFIYPYVEYLPRIIHENASTSSYMSTIGDDGFAGRNVKKYLIKTNCLSNSNSSVTGDIIMPPQNECCTNCSIPCRFRYVQKKISFNSDQLQKVDPVCSNQSLKQIIIEHANDDINRSKIRIQRAAIQIIGGLFGVICGNDNFAYIIQTKDFCQHRTGNITCYIFRSLLDYNKINIP